MSLPDSGEDSIGLSHARTLLAGLEEGRGRGELLDTVIRGAGGPGVTCHRLVLTAVSSVLREAVQDTEEEVIIIAPDLSGQEVEAFVQLLYTGAAQTRSSNVDQLLRALKIPLPSEASEEHLADVDKKPETASCPGSLLNCQSKEALATHLVTHLGDFKCSSCSLLFPSKVELEEHKVNEHRDSEKQTAQHEPPPTSLNLGKNIQCTKCDEIFRWKAEFRRHSEVVHGQKITDLIPCSVCHKMIVSKRLNEHIKTVHGNEKNLSCQQCEKKFSKPSELRNHIRTHTGERPFTCDICDASFAYSHILTRHKKYHDGTKKFTCKECGKSFLQKNDLVKHGRIHSGEKPYSCDTCGKDFARMDYLKKHLMLHASSDSKYCCNDCGEILSSLDGLKKHKSHSHRANIDLNSFDDLALQLPGLEMESMPDSIQAVSLDGGKTIMILNEVADMEALDTGPGQERPAELVLEPGDAAPVLYAVQY